jgi:prevent-host-death family protein
MPIVGLRELSKKTSDVIELLEEDGEPVLITRHGKPIAALTALTEKDVAAYALAVLPDHIQRREDATRAIAEGDGIPSDELLAEVEAEDAADGIEQDPERAEQAAEDLEIPSVLVEQLADSTLREISDAENVVISGAVREASRTYVSALLLNTLPVVRERFRTISTNIIADHVGLSGEEYASELQRAAAAETLAIPQAQG